MLGFRSDLCRGPWRHDGTVAQFRKHMDCHSSPWPAAAQYSAPEEDFAAAESAVFVFLVRFRTISVYPDITVRKGTKFRERPCLNALRNRPNIKIGGVNECAAVHLSNYRSGFA